ncbi:hypothetical protein AB0H82_12240 [Streptomyces sp. NPDC050732]|uniref:hypothetical protein n=1 Tax=Streptomyces sp. NPDC050732 TaxID=3154632 RepID=UPI0034416197
MPSADRASTGAVVRRVPTGKICRCGTTAGAADTSGERGVRDRCTTGTGRGLGVPLAPGAGMARALVSGAVPEVVVVVAVRCAAVGRSEVGAAAAGGVPGEGTPTLGTAAPRLLPFPSLCASRLGCWAGAAAGAAVGVGLEAGGVCVRGLEACRWTGRPAAGS